DKAVGGSGKVGGAIASSATKNNDLLLKPDELANLVFDNGRAEEFCKEQGIPATQENIDAIKSSFIKFIEKNSESDAIIVTGGFGTEYSYIYDLKYNEHYLAAGGSIGPDGISGSLSLVAVKIIASDSSVDVNDDKVREEILTGTSVGANIYLGVGGGISVPFNSKYAGKVTLIVKGIGTPQISISGSETQTVEDKAQNIYNDSMDNKYGLD
ncbi:hypothetical protein, partial [uncultured Phascolarctobacterium sp.]|uniref:hypothetical protein n=1 Tax=uncultured Phascolarctobacterium sp. TaxID=512296 RepID=UPI0025E07028